MSIPYDRVDGGGVVDSGGVVDDGGVVLPTAPVLLCAGSVRNLNELLFLSWRIIAIGKLYL